MIKVSSPDDIAEQENMIKKTLGSETVLIERAASKLFDTVKARFSHSARIAVFAGRGNNGSDALSLAEKLIADGYCVKIYGFSGPRTQENGKFARRLMENGAETIPAARFDGNADLIIDGIIGTGLSRAAEGETAAAIKKINLCPAQVISIDIPTGLNAVSGAVTGDAVRADLTVAFTAVKQGLILGEGPDFAGKVLVADIGVNARACGEIIDEDYASLPPRKKATHKGDYGRVSIIGGCDNMPGAPLMAYESAVAATRGGAGLVRLCVGENEKCAYKARVVEQTLFYLPECGGYISFDEKKFKEITEWSDAIVLGPGMGANPFLREIIGYLCVSYEKTLVLDADALNSLSRNMHLIENHRCRLVLTPHVGEFARIAPGTEIYDTEALKRFAKKYGCILVLKSACTIITDGNTLLFNTSGTPAQAKGGSGDVLAGVMGALCAVNFSIKSAAAACFYLGRSAEKVSRKMQSDVSVTAGDVIVRFKENAVDGNFTADDLVIRNLV